jgi:hypothetical protein
MPRFTVEASWLEIFSAAVWGLLVFTGFRVTRLYGSASPQVAVATVATQTEDPRDEIDSGPSGVPGEKVPSGDDGPGESDCGYEPGAYSPGPSSDECPFAYEDRKDCLWHLREEVQAWDRYQAELREVQFCQGGTRPGAVERRSASASLIAPPDASASDILCAGPS